MQPYVGPDAPYYATEIEAGDVGELPDDDPGASLTYEDDERKRNRIRAGFAIVGLKAYAERVGLLHDEPIETAIGDLLGDLRHLIDALNGGNEDGVESSLDGLFTSSYDRYAEEIRGE